MSYVGQGVRRREDPRLVRGEGRYAGDLRFPGMLHAGFVRSTEAHARLLSVDLSAAHSLPGIVAAYSARELPYLARPTPSVPLPPGLRGHGLFPLVPDVVRYVGDPIAVVLSEDPVALADALELVSVDYDPLPAVIGIGAALRGNIQIWEDVPGNVAVDFSLGFGDSEAGFEQAEVILEERFHFARSAGAALEPRAMVAMPGGQDGWRLTVWDSTQAPHNVRDALCSYLDLPHDEVRVVAPDVGGGFGPKGRVYGESYVVSALALQHSRSVRWVATRTEDLLTTAHGGGQEHRVRLAARRDGTVLALEDSIVQDAGAYTAGGLAAPMNTVRHLIGPYRLPALSVHLRAVYTNAAMTSPLRGGGRQNGIYVVERMMDRLAAHLRLDRAEVRRRNFIPPEDFPHDTGMAAGSGGTVVYDSGNFPVYLDRALEAIGYDRLRAEREQAREGGRFLGVGLAAFIESTGVGAEGARIEAMKDGRVRVAVGSPSTGQGHATTFAQMAAERIGVPLDSVELISGDTGAFGWGTGTFASRMGQYGGNAVSLASHAFREKVLHLAAEMLEIAPQDLDLIEGRVIVRGVPDRSLTVATIAREAEGRGEPLSATATYQPAPANTWSGGVNAALVEVDMETGHVSLLQYVVVHDCGTVVNPVIVEGQVHGGVVHGIGVALYEECLYTDDGQFATATLTDYRLPGIGDVLPIETSHVETPSPFNPEGIKGAGEGGTIGALPTLAAAVEDALSPFGVTIRDLPIHKEHLAAIVARADSGVSEISAPAAVHT